MVLKNKKGLRLTIRILGLVSISLIGILIIFKFWSLFILYSKLKPLCPECNIILVVVDTLSSNHLPCYGYFRDTAPHFCAFGRNNIFFKNNYSNATWTLPSHVSLFTSLYPSTHGVVSYQKNALKASVPFLPEMLQKRGYKTLFFIPPDDEALPINTVYSRGINEFVSYSNSWSEPLERFRRSVLDHQKTFLFLHTYFVHAPYLIENSPLLYANESGIINQLPLTERQYSVVSSNLVDYLIKQIPLDIERGYIDKNNLIVSDLYQFLLENKQGQNKILEYVAEFRDKYPYLFGPYLYNANWLSKIDVSNQKHLDFIRALYDQKIYQLDQNLIKTLINFVGQQEFDANTVVIITSDHGEEFGEHGTIEHSTLFDTNIKTPLIISVPKISPKSIDYLTQSVDLVPTILDIVGIKYNSVFQGQSLVRYLLGSPEVDRFIVTDGFMLKSRAIRRGVWKLLLTSRGVDLVPNELFNITMDPNETKSVLFDNLRVASRLLKEYLSSRVGL